MRLKSGKRVHAFAAEGDVDPDAVNSQRFEMEWPRGSGRRQSFPEIDRVQFVDPETARRLLNPAQVPLIDDLLRRLADERRDD